MPTENGKSSQINPKSGHPYGKRFGIEKPAIAGPGRPRLPDSVKDRRAFLRKKLEEISVDATELIQEIIDDTESDTRDRIRAAEIALSHALPRQEEVTLDDERPLREIDANQLESKLAELNASSNGHASNGGNQT